MRGNPGKTHIKAMTRIPINWFTMVKVGSERGTVPLVLRMFQSNVGQGLRPTPVIMPVTATRSALLGEIHEIQLK
jgi:hypothetical protein